MSKALRGLILAGLPLLSSACADFDEQALHLFYDKDTDLLSLLVLYQGIYFKGDPRESQEQLDRFVTSASRPASWSIALGDNWIGHLEKETFERVVRDASATARERQAASALVENLDVVCGRFYRDREKRLCGYQRITLRNASRVLKALNGLLSEALPKAVREMKAPFNLNERSMEGFDRAAAKDHPWIALEGQSLRFKCPLDAEDFKTWKGLLLDQLRGMKVEEVQPLRAFLAENDVSLIREGSWVTLVLGDPKAKGPVRVMLKPREGKYEENLVSYVEGKYGMEAGLTEPAILDPFMISLVKEDRARALDGFVRDLGDDDVEKREAAAAEIIEIGRLASPWLRKALLSGNAEIQARAAALLSEIAP
jgi:hypothetical protein